MKAKYTEDEFNEAKAQEKLKLECYQCGEEFYKKKNLIQLTLNGYVAKRGVNYSGGCKYCSHKCQHEARILSQEVQCNQCGKEFVKLMCHIRSSPKHYCSRSCAATYNNTHKTHGTRRSKLEVWLEKQLPALYPSLEFHFNRKDAINAELDIYVPSLKLAFELNGPLHYEPIFGADKLAQIQNNDQRKHAACYEAGIEMCWIDASTFGYFKESGAMKFLDMISGVLQKKMSAA